MNRRNTIQRQLVSETVRSLDHPNAEEVYEAIAKNHPHVSKATVYRNLNLLAEQAEIGKIKTSEGADRFDCRTDRHFHMRCRVCGRLFDAPFFPPELPLEADETEGFIIEGYTVEIFGTCSDCNKKSLEVSTNGKRT